MRTYSIITALALLFSLVFSVIENGRSATSNFLFHLNVWNQKGAREDIAVSITQYNKNSGGFYNTAGESLEGLAVIPASQLQKRKFFQDINMLKRDGLVMVFDLDRQTIERIYFVNRNTAVAVSEEVWAVALQDLESRRPLSNVKAASVKVRYLMHYEPALSGKMTWIVQEADVYPHGERVPELNMQRVF